ncbi:hypothetical protein HDV04_005910 [Boothiomyces sp. JEL0838]|nr:hypothetical protein HDV04_005910 [Boothiomyces sp. JEL0838]
MDEKEKQQRLEFAKSKFKSYQKKKRESEAMENSDQSKAVVEPPAPATESTSMVYPNSPKKSPIATSGSPKVLVQQEVTNQYQDNSQNHHTGNQQHYQDQIPYQEGYTNQYQQDIPSHEYQDSHVQQYQETYSYQESQQYQEAPQYPNESFNDYSSQYQNNQSVYDQNALLNEIAQLQNEKYQLAETINQISSENQIQKNENAELHTEIKKQKQTQASLELKIDQHVKELKQVLLKNQQLQSKETNNHAKSDAYEGKYHELEILHQQLQAKCNALEEDNLQLISSNKQLENDFLRITNDLQDRDTAIEELNNELNVKNSIIEENEAKLVELESQLQETKQKSKLELDAVNNTLATQQETVQLMKQKVQDITKQLQTTQDAFNVTKQDEIKLKNENQELFSQLSELRQKIVSTQNEKQELVEETSKLKYYISRMEKEGRRNSIGAARSSSVSVPQPQMYQMGNQTSPSLLSPGLISPSNPITEKSPNVQSADNAEHPVPSPITNDTKEVATEENIDQLKAKLLDLNINYTALVKEKQATVANLTQQTMSLKLENDELRKQLGNSKASQATIENLQQTINQNQNVIRHLEKELDNEKRLTVLLQAELEALPDMIQKYHQERQNLLQKVNKINLQESKKEVVVVKKESIRIHCGECAGNPVIQL